MNRIALWGLFISFIEISETAEAVNDVKRKNIKVTSIFFMKYADERE